MSEVQYKVSFDDAIRNVAALDDIPLPDDVPCIQALNSAVNYQVNFDTNFGDSGAFRIAHARYPEEARVQSELHKLLEDGREYAIMLYTWRSCSRALPPIKSNEQPYRIQIYEKTVDILEPYVAKLREFKIFQQCAIDRFCEEVKRLCHEKKRDDFVSSAYLLSLGRLLCMFAQLDEMKNMKASMKNDHSHYKRATQFLRNLDRESMQESQVLSLFLAEQNVIRNKLCEQLTKISGHEDLIADIVTNALQMYENHLYVLPEERHTLVLMMAFGLHIIDCKTNNNSTNIYKMASSRHPHRLNLSKFDKTLKECEVVNLFGDMSLSPFNYIKITPHYDASKWPECNNSSKISSQGVLLDHMTRFREEYAALTAELAWHTNLVTTRESGRSKMENKELYSLMLRALQLLSGWTVQMLDTYTWKLAHCADWHQNPQCPKDAEDYEKAVRFNYSSAEKFALIEVLGMVKAVQSQLTRLDASYSEGVRAAIYMDLQQFAVAGLAEPYRKAHKSSKRAFVALLIESIRAVCLDNIQDGSGNNILAKSTSSSTLGSNPSDSLPHNKGTGGSSAASTSKEATQAVVEAAQKGIRPRDVGPSGTQLYIVRTTVESMISSGRPGVAAGANRVVGGGSGGGNPLRKELDSNSLLVLESFHRASFYWPYLLNLSDTVAKCCDMSQFWFREFYLELTNGARVQFPIEMSVPWILTQHALDNHATLIELLLCPLDLYNDSARCALMSFHQRFLYDEIEAEANLAFDQLVWRLSELIFVHYKQVVAGGMLLDKRYRAVAAVRISSGDTSAGDTLPGPPPYPGRFASLLKQRQVQLLGRSIDLNKLLTQRLNKAIFKSLNTAISRFRSSDITGIVELEALLDCNRQCHKILSEYFDLDVFDSLLQEANHSVKSHLGCISQHVFWEINYDLSHNYCYNDATNRFVLTAVPFGEKLLRDNAPVVGPEYVWGSKALNQAYENMFGVYSGFVGNQHVRVICRLLGYQGVYVVVAELMKICESMIKTNLRNIVHRLLQVMPSQLKPSKTGQSSDQLFSEYYKQLEGIYQMSALSTDMCQSFREFGNIIIFILMLEQNLTIQESCDLKQAAAFTGIIPRPYVSSAGIVLSSGEGGTPSPGNNTPNTNTMGRKDVARESMIKEMTKKLEYKYAVMNVAKITSKLGSPEQAQLAQENEILTKERLCCGLVMFEQVLRKLQESLRAPDPELMQLIDNTEKKDGTTESAISRYAPPGNIWHGLKPENDVMQIRECSEFHRVWSAVQFVFCTPRGENEFNIEELFGEGLNWAGCVIIALLGQQKRFEALDIGAHLMRVQFTDQKSGLATDNVSLDRLAQRIRRFNVLNSQIFATINRYLCPVDRYTALAESVRHFPTPMYQQPQPSGI